MKLIDVLLENDCKNILLFGDGGSGKSTQMINAFRFLLKKHQTESYKVIPIFIDVKYIDYCERFPLFKYIYNVYCGKDSSNENIDINVMHVFETGDYTFIILLDGLNETVQKNNILNDMNKILKCKNVRFVVTSRICEKDFTFAKFTKYRLLNIDENRVIEIIEKKYNLNHALDISRLEPNLLHILKSPLFLTVFLNSFTFEKALERLCSEKTVTRQGDILNAYIEKLIRDIHSKNTVDENECSVFVIKYYMPCLAYIMSKHGLFKVFDKHLVGYQYNYKTDDCSLSVKYFRGLLFGRDKKLLSSYKKEIDTINDYCLNTGLIKYNEFTKAYEFSHHIWRDFFAAIHTCNLMNAERFNELEYLPSVPTCCFVGELLKVDNKSECDYESKKHCSTDMSPIENYMQHHYIELNETPKAIKTLIEIMKICRHNKITARYDNLNLSDALFVKCSFPNSSFSNSIVYERNFYIPGHSGYVYDSDISNDNKYIVSCGKDGTVRIFDIQGHYQKGNALRGHTNYVSSVVVLSDGTIISGSYDKTIRKWDSETHTEQGVFSGHTERINDIAVSPDELIVASAGNDGEIMLWDIAAAKLKEELHCQTRVNCIQFSKDGKYIISGEQNGTLRVWNINSHKQEKIMSCNCSIQSVGVTTNYILCGLKNGNVVIWDFYGNEIDKIEGVHKASIEAIAISPNEELFFTAGYEGYLGIWDLKSKELICRPIKAHDDWINGVNISHDGRYLVTAGGDEAVKLWDVETLSMACEPFVGSSAWINDVKITSDSKRIVTGGDDSVIRIFDYNSSRLLIEPLLGHSARINALQISQDNLKVFSGSDDSDVIIWSIDDGSILHTLSDLHKDWIRSICVSKDGRYLISGSWDHEACVYDLENGKIRNRLTKHTASVEAITITGDGALIITGSDDNTIRFWDFDTGRQIDIIKLHDNWIRALALSNNERYIVTGSWDNTIKLFDLYSKRVLSFTGHTNRIDAVAFTEDNKHVVSASDDNTVRLWDIGSADSSQIIAQHNNAVSTLTITPDGKIISGDGDGVLLVTDIQTLKNTKITQLSLNGFNADVSSISPRSQLSPEFSRVLFQNGFIL